MSPFTITCLLVLSAAAVAAGPAPAGPTFENLLMHVASGAAAKVSAADYSRDGEHYYAHETHDEAKRLMLSETSQTNCRFFGCQDRVSASGCSGGRNCFYCRVGRHWTSQFSCKKDEDYHHKDGGANNLFNTQGMAGYCNWDYLGFRDFTDLAGNGDNVCGWVEVNPGRSYQASTVVGKCHFPGGDNCDGPLCKDLKITITADMYITKAYSRSLPAVAPSDTLCVNWPTVDNGDCGILPPFNNARFAREEEEGKAAKKVATASTNYYHDIDILPSTFYNGTAVIISGQITSINGQRYEKGSGRFSDGLVEYVPYMYVDATPIPVTGNLDPMIPIVQPNTYKIEFYRDGSRYYAE